MSRLRLVSIVVVLAVTPASVASEGGCPCPADTNGCGTVDVMDLINVILDWGTNGSEFNGDVTDDGIVNVLDLLEIIFQWGPCPSACCGNSNAGDCFAANGTPYCDDAGCCEIVCAAAPECCETAWDEACADLAASQCAGGG